MKKNEFAVNGPWFKTLTVPPIWIVFETDWAEEIPAPPRVPVAAPVKDAKPPTAPVEAP